MKTLWLDDIKRLLPDQNDREIFREKDKENVIPMTTYPDLSGSTTTKAQPAAEERRPLIKKRSQIKISANFKAPGDLLRQASKSKDLLIGAISTAAPREILDPAAPMNRDSLPVNDTQNRKMFRRVETTNDKIHGKSSARTIVSFKEDKNSTAEKPSNPIDRTSREKVVSKRQEDVERGDKEARKERENQRKRDLENSRALALKKMQTENSSLPTETGLNLSNPPTSGDTHEEMMTTPTVEIYDESNPADDLKKLKLLPKRKVLPNPKNLKKSTEGIKPLISPRGTKDEETVISPREQISTFSRDFIAMKKSKSIREIFFKGNGEDDQSAADSLKDKFLRTRRNSKRNLEGNLISSKSADSVPDFPSVVLPALPLLPTILSADTASPASKDEEEIEDPEIASDEDPEIEHEVLSNHPLEHSKLNLDDILNSHILGSGLSCSNCHVDIPEGVSSILFQNRRYHFKCYVCYHCNCSLLEHVPLLEKELLMCEDCHFALF
jgi:hypothetical protein